MGFEEAIPRQTNAEFEVRQLREQLSAVTSERDRLRVRVAQFEQFNKSLNEENARLFSDYCAADDEAVTLSAALAAKEKPNDRN